MQVIIIRVNNKFFLVAESEHFGFGCICLQFADILKSIPISFKKNILRVQFESIKTSASTFLGNHLFLLAVNTLPPVEKTRSDLDDEAGIAKTLLAILASKGRTFICCFHQERTSQSLDCRGKSSYFSISILIFGLFHFSNQTFPCIVS